MTYLHDKHTLKAVGCFNTRGTRKLWHESNSATNSAITHMIRTEHEGSAALLATRFAALLHLPGRCALTVLAESAATTFAMAGRKMAAAAAASGNCVATAATTASASAAATVTSNTTCTPPDKRRLSVPHRRRRPPTASPVLKRAVTVDRGTSSLSAIVSDRPVRILVFAGADN